MIEDKAALPVSQPPILSYVKDLPNLCSLSGLACTLSAIYFCFLGIYSAAMIAMVWAVAFDWADGLVARKLHGRTGYDRAFGGTLDVLIDIVSYGVTPAIVLMTYTNFQPLFLVAAFVMVAASALRLSYFVTYGLADGTKYTGLALDNNSLILVFVFLFEPITSGVVFTAILFIVCITLAGLNVSQIKTPKFSGNPISVNVLASYTILMSGLYLYQLL